jgi:hypothetical protein
MSRPRLRLAEPAATVPDTRASVARALLDRWAPVATPVADQELTMLNPDGGTGERYRELASDPRYLIGRLSQALTALLSADIPPMDATAELLGQAIEDAIAYRRRTCPACERESPETGICAGCWPSWRQANAYEGLSLSLGIIGDPRPPRLRVAGSER